MDPSESFVKLLASILPNSRSSSWATFNLVACRRKQQRFCTGHGRHGFSSRTGGKFPTGADPSIGYAVLEHSQHWQGWKSWHFGTIGRPWWRSFTASGSDLWTRRFGPPCQPFGSYNSNIGWPSTCDGCNDGSGWLTSFSSLCECEFECDLPCILRRQPLACVIRDQGTYKSIIWRQKEKPRGSEACVWTIWKDVKLLCSAAICMLFSCITIVFTSFPFRSRGHRPIVDTCANEAIPQWGKRRLITSVYLQFSIFRPWQPAKPRTGKGVLFQHCTVVAIWKYLRFWNLSCIRIQRTSEPLAALSKAIESFFMEVSLLKSPKQTCHFYWIVCARTMHSTPIIRKDVSD